jgi:hypothetical protein
MRRAILLCVSMLAVAAFAAAAPATIVPQRSIAGVSLGMTKAQVRAKLGAPLKVRSGQNDFGPYSKLVYPRVNVSFQSGNKVTALETRSALEQTAGGARVGLTKAQLRARLPAVKCETGHCFLGAFLPGKRVTDFTLRNGRVTRVTVGFVLD